MSDFFTPKQQKLISIFKHEKLKRINILEGSVRSGKTWISLVLWALWIATMPEDQNYLMVGKTMTALKRNCLELLKDLVGEDNFTYSFSGKEGRLFGRRIYLEGVNDVRAEGKIRGMTLAGAYCDEITLFTEDFFSMLLSRLSVKSAKLIGTTNPDNPNHWLLKKYIKRQEELNLFSMRFLIDDNTKLDPEYITSIKKEYTGVYYERFILGNWVKASGLVYGNFSEIDHLTDAINVENPFEYRYFISIDYGTINPFAMLLWRIDRDGNAVLVKEYYYNSREERRQKTDEQYYQDLQAFAKWGDTDLYIEMIVIDPSAASFIELLRQKGEYAFRKADNEVLEGIRTTANLLSIGKIKIDRHCENTIDEFKTYSWDERSEEDKVIKESDHAMDAMRYFVMTILKNEMSGRW